MPTNWHVVVGFDATLGEDAPLDIAEQLAEHGAVTSVSRAFTNGTVDLTVEAPSVVDAIEKGSALVAKTLKLHSDDVTLTAVRAQSEEDLELELSTPSIPEVVGYAEIATLAGVSRQRARQFADIADFPKPAIVTAQGPLMTKSSVMRWLENRNTRSRSATPAHA
jgi:hypothetical protein